MKKISFLFCTLLFSVFSFSQEVELSGTVYANSDIEGIHIINRTSQRFATTNNKGEFTISAKFNDTILVSSVRYKQKLLLVSRTNISTRSLKIYLDEHVNELDKVVVGKVLTGALDSDIENEGEERPMDFYDVGIPGFVGKRKTQKERKLYEADHGKFYAFPFTLNTNKILNALSGRTKRLKEHVRLEKNNVLVYRVRAKVGDMFFNTHSLDEDRRMDFFFFCSDDPDFVLRCQGKSDIEIYEFLDEKYIDYVANIQEED